MFAVVEITRHLPDFRIQFSQNYNCGIKVVKDSEQIIQLIKDLVNQYRPWRQISLRGVKELAVLFNCEMFH